MTRETDFDAAAWVRSSHSTSDGGQCLEWMPRRAADLRPVPVRDSKHPEGPVLLFGASEWTGFVTALENGDLGSERFSFG
ncbi:DUF397 domain-containing protein [Streptomyces alkaliphilus]|uniref:DUF397 domain-containing protein n=1 Tax=Streptomyces alkaliphilus TaxID=1472722 RepID=UPI00117D1A3F|nr:DUF397 domain-containing protein [Streptomyces alkaliphilus]MQS06563.1 DUF397 domain-containing protein [Streptomyces alkaliphilus]